MAMDKKCGSDTEQGCPQLDGLLEVTTAPNEWWEEDFMYGFRKWHFILLGMAASLTFIILLCCCLKYRIPRTKQEIEGDYVRRRILRKFRQRLKAIQNQELDEMDLKRALDKIRAEFKSDTESLAQSEAGFSVATISSAGGLPGAGGHHHGQSSTYRRASQIQIDISLEDLRVQSMGLGARMALAMSRLFSRSKVSQSDVPIGENAVTENLLNPQSNGEQQQEASSKTTIPGNTKTKNAPSKLASVSVTIPEVEVPTAVNDKKSEKKSKGKSKEKVEKSGTVAGAPVENLDVKNIDKESKRNKKKHDAEKGKSEKAEKDNKVDKEKEKVDKAEKLKADREKEKNDKLEKEREKKEKLEKEKREKKEKAEKEKKEKAEREKKEKETKSKDKEQKTKSSAVLKENNIKDKK